MNNPRSEIEGYKAQIDGIILGLAAMEVRIKQRNQELLSILTDGQYASKYLTKAGEWLTVLADTCAKMDERAI